MRNATDTTSGRPPGSGSLRLSKSRFTTGLQCYRQLWWQAHEPDAPELVADAAQRAIFDQGSEVGRVARERVPGGVLIEFPYRALAERVEATRIALESGAPAIYEASFIADETFAAVDILERVPGGWALIEVKSTTKPKREHLPDIAVQLHVVLQSGLTVVRAELMHLNRACAYPDLADLFARVDVTHEVEPLLAEVPAEIGRQLAMLRNPLPDVPIGRHCDEPYTCPFKSRCWPELPEHHISTLYYVGNRRWELEAQGVTVITDLPEDFPLQPQAERQRRAIRAGATVVEPGLGPALAALEGPLAIVDFETVSPAIPVWNGCHPYDPVPVQFSCHAQDGRGGWIHSEWIADGPEDPRPELVRRLATACEGARTILAYYAEYERQCLKLVAEALPELREQVDRILARLADALPLVRDHVYHLGFGGSFSLKAVLPALAPDLRYDVLEIADGMAASRELQRLLLDGGTLPPAERERLRESLRRYCELDTWGVVRLLERLEDLARGAPPGS
jgi:predicted RecB family nuclease